MDFLVDGVGERERDALLVLVVLVDGLLRHRERARQRDLDRTIGIRAQELHVAHFDGRTPLDRP